MAALIVLAAVNLALASPRDVRAQVSGPTDPLSIVQSFLLARDMGDYEGAANWCASLMELQDEDSWFVDPSSTSDWLRQLTTAYLIDTLSPPRAQGNVVTWTERLTRRGSTSAPAEGPARMTVEVHAVIKDGRIATLSAPYPPIPVRTRTLPTTELASVSQSVGRVQVPPEVLFVLTALGLGLTVLLANRLGTYVRRAVTRSSRHGQCDSQQRHTRR